MDEKQLQALVNGEWEKAGLVPPSNAGESHALNQQRLLAGILLKLISIEKMESEAREDFKKLQSYREKMQKEKEPDPSKKVVQ